MLFDDIQASFPIPLRFAAPKSLIDSSGNRLQSEPEDEPFDPLDSAREATEVTQRRIVLALQRRLEQVVNDGGSLDDICRLSEAIAINLQVNDHILEIFD